ncbi:MAG: DUF2931 family protein [Prevotella sp.]|nr:DUF2931 family protein [Prevotella sp.]
MEQEVHDKYNYTVAGIAHELYPADICFCVLWCHGDEQISVMPERPFSGEWGIPKSISHSLMDDVSLPEKIDMIWLSVVERKYYTIEAEIPSEKLNSIFRNTEQPISMIVVGMAPYGGVALWAMSESKSYLIGWFHGQETYITLEDFLQEDTTLTLEKLCDYYISNNTQAKKNMETRGLPSRNIFDKYMQQYIYKYVILLEKWDEKKEKWTRYEDEAEPQFDYMEEVLYDGSYDKRHDSGLLKYHEAGKPKKISMRWHIGRKEYTAYIWFEEEKTRNIYEKFYGADTDTMSDFVIRIDAEKHRYELLLNRYGIKEPHIIPQSAYQMIVFKNKFEDYRSDNYEQEQGAWIW